jgi:hypothetical protein
MFGAFDDVEGAKAEYEHLQKTSAAKENDLRARIDRLTGILGDLFLRLEPAATPFDWENTQAEYYSKGFESTLMGQATRGRNACSAACDMIRKELATLGQEPHQVGSVARARREAEEKQAHAARLRSEAARLEEEARSALGS